MKVLARETTAMIGLLWLGATVVACGLVGTAEGQREEPVPNKSIEDVLKEHTSKLMSLPGVVGTGQGLCSGEPCIRIFVVQKTDDLLKQIPPEIDGYPIDIQETGEFRKREPG